jgi:hypothetical protein
MCRRISSKDLGGESLGKDKEEKLGRDVPGQWFT